MKANQITSIYKHPASKEIDACALMLAKIEQTAPKQQNLKPIIQVMLFHLFCIFKSLNEKAFSHNMKNVKKKQVVAKFENH